MASLANTARATTLPKRWCCSSLLGIGRPTNSRLRLDATGMSVEGTFRTPTTVRAVHVVVVGCGRVGSSLAVRLVEEGHTVAIIDKRSQSFSRLPENFPGRMITGFGFDRDRLKEAGIEEADALAAVTSGDNSNILVARVARETFGVESVMARIYDPGRAAIYERVGIPTVATVSWTTDQAMRRL